MAARGSAEWQGTIREGSGTFHRRRLAGRRVLVQIKVRGRSGPTRSS